MSSSVSVVGVLSYPPTFLPSALKYLANDDMPMPPIPTKYTDFSLSKSILRFSLAECCMGSWLQPVKIILLQRFRKSLLQFLLPNCAKPAVIYFAKVDFVFRDHLSIQ